MSTRLTHADKDRIIEELRAQLHNTQARVCELEGVMTLKNNEIKLLSEKCRSFVAQINARENGEFTLEELRLASARYCTEHKVSSVSRADVIKYLRENRHLMRG